MFEIFQNSMAIICYFKHLELFGTMIANHEWLEITTTLLPWQKAKNWLNLVVRIFKFKSQALLWDIIKSYVLGQIVAHVYTIEFKKWGLPHMHFFIFFVAKEKIIFVVVVDRIVFVEFPSLEIDPILFNTILRTMVHDPYGHAIFIFHAWKMQGVPNVIWMESKNWPLWMLMYIFCIKGKTTFTRLWNTRLFSWQLKCCALQSISI